jgi:membrane-associated phospholipid phosphatase
MLNALLELLTRRSASSQTSAQLRNAFLRRRLEPQSAFLRARLSTSGYLGLRFTAGVGILLVATWLFSCIAYAVMTGDSITLVDEHVAQWLHGQATPVLTQVMRTVSKLHNTMAMIIMTLVFAAVLIAKRHWWWLVSLILAVPGGMLLNVSLKHAFQRARPSFDLPLVSLHTYSFPSGHTVTSTLFYGILAAFIISATTSRTARVWAVLAAFSMVILVAFSRLYLGAHYLSDVLAAMAVGLAWLALCLTGMHAYTSRPPSRS